jgi:hypothetical protein
VAGAGALAMLLAGCMPVPSLRPLFTEEESIFEPRLLGEWRAAPTAGDVALHFERAGEKSYRLTYKQDDDSVSFYDARVGRVGDSLFLDVEPEESHVEELLAEEAWPQLLPFHTFYRVEVDGGVLRLFFLDHDWLEEKIAGGEITIPHEIIKDSILLTATTEELQALVVRYAQDEEAFSQLDPLDRSPGDGS